MSDTIVNKIANSGLITIDLEKYLPIGDVVTFDLKDHLFMGLILKEKDFRESLKQIDWEIYRDKYVAITCTADAIIPVWAYMLVAAYLQPVAQDFIMGDEKQLHRHRHQYFFLIRDFRDIQNQLFFLSYTRPDSPHLQPL